MAENNWTKKNIDNEWVSTLCSYIPNKITSIDDILSMEQPTKWTVWTEQKKKKGKMKQKQKKKVVWMMKIAVQTYLRLNILQLTVKANVTLIGLMWAVAVLTLFSHLDFWIALSSEHFFSSLKELRVFSSSSIKCLL